MVMAAFMMAFTSCSKDKSKLIIGKWSSMEGSYMIMDELGKMTLPTDSYTFTFNNDNTCTLSYDIMGLQGEETATYSINGDDLIIDGQEIDIEELSNTRLVLEFDSDSFFSDDDDEYEDEDDSDNFKAHLEFKKVK